MRPKPTPANTKQNDNRRNTNSMASPGSSMTSGLPPTSTNASKGGKIPWSGIAAGGGSGSSPVNSSIPMSFASAAARSSNSSGRPTMGSPSLSRGTLQRSQLGGSGSQSASSHQNKSSTPFSARSRREDSKEFESFQKGDDKPDPTPESILAENSGGRSYSVNEMLSIWEDMKRSNAIKPSVDQKNDLFHSILPNQPAILDHSLQHAHTQEPQQQPHESGSNGGDTGLLANASHSNQSSISANSNANGNPTPFADRLLSAKPSLSELHKENGFTQHKPFSQSDMIDSSASSIVLPGTTASSSWSPFGATAPSLATNNESIFKANGILPKNDLFSSGVGLHSGTPPPGISSPIPTILPPESINWVYKDPSGAEQGPFNGIRMQEWYASKWLHESLLIRRAEETDFYMLKDFMVRVNNFLEPFLVPQLPVMRGSFFEDPQIRMQEEMLARQREALRRQQQLQFASLQLQQQNSGWGSMSPITTPMSPMSPWAQPQSLSQPQPISTLGNSNPFDFGGLPGSQVSLNHINNDVWQPRAPGSIPQTPRRVPSVTELNSLNDTSVKRSLLSELEDSDVQQKLSYNKDDLFESEEFLIRETPIASQSAIQPPAKSPPVEPVSIAEESAFEKIEPVSIAEEQDILKEEKKSASEPQVKKAKASKIKSKKSILASDQQTPAVSSSAKVDELAEELTSQLEFVQTEDDTQSFEESSPDSPTQSPKPVAPVLAPWAKREAVKPKTPSLKEIQEIEAAERKTRKAQQQQQQAAAAAAALLQASRSGASTPVSALAPALPSGATWATVGPSPNSAPKKTLAQIQKEEEEAARKRTPTAAPPAGVRRYVDIATPSPTSYSARASAASAAPAPAIGGAWTTVGPGGKRVGGGLTSTPSSVPASTTTSPTHRKVEPAVRAVSGTSSVSSGVKLSSSGEEFLNWCKASLQDLQAGVNQAELLSMFFSLPASSESKEIIAESIYSSSTTMDGRRFAEEFLKRRKGVDSEISSHSWSDVLSKTTSTPSKPVNDGWNVSFKVVGKKKGRRE